MPAELNYVVEDGGLAVSLANAPNVVGSKVLANMRLLGQEYERNIKQMWLSGQMLNARTGTGRRSIFYRLEVNAQDAGVELLVGADLGKAKYMRAQALGAVIRPKNSRYLAIPIGAALTGNKVARFTARELFASPGSFGYLDAFVHKSVVFGVKQRKKQKGTIGEIVPLFVLKTSVTLPSRNYLDAARIMLDHRTRELIDDIATATVRSITEGGNAGGAQ